MNKLMTKAMVFFPGRGPQRAAAYLGGAVFGAVAALAVLSGCATATIEDAVPQGALEQPADAADTEAAEKAVSSGAPDNTGEYPNLNEVQRGELEQMTPAEKQAYLEKLRAARAEQASGGAKGGGPGARQAELKKIARTHDEEALKQIEEGSDDPATEN